MTKQTSFPYFLLIILILMAVPGVLYSQEAIIPLESNVLLNNYNPPKSKKAPGDTLQLPFFEDFSYSSFYPDDSIWQDRQAFVNNTMAIDPVSIGVATFDGLNENGLPYQPGRANSRGYAADTLTSRYIDLSGLSNKDSLIFSFFYQPQGHGDIPESYDSLTLQFKPDSVWTGSSWKKEEWITVWSKTGTAVHPFKMVMIPFVFPDTPNFFHKGFQFRFVNYANLSGNLDHWHVDYIYLNKERKKADSTFIDFSIVKAPVSVLKDYHAMPLYQFRKNPSKELRETLRLVVRNNNDSLNIAGARYRITNLADGKIAGEIPNNIFENVSPFYQTHEFAFKNNFDHLKISTTSAQIEITSIIEVTPDFFKSNNVYRKKQYLENFYAYDDGTAESGYGLKETRSGKVAQQYSINEPDSIRGVAFYFNPSKEDLSTRKIDIVIWKRISTGTGSGTNEEEIARIRSVSPVKPGWIGGFRYFQLEKPVFVSGSFYVGWEQSEKFILNIGLDKSYPELTEKEGPNPNLYYNVENEWLQTKVVEGALMIRPYMGGPDSGPVSIPENEKNKGLTVFPNPAKDQVNIDYPFEGKGNLRIVSPDGRVVFSTEGELPSTINVSGFPQGLYILQVAGQGTPNFHHMKIVINR